MSATEFSVCVWCDARVEWTASADRAKAEARLRRGTFSKTEA